MRSSLVSVIALCTSAAIATPLPPLPDFNLDHGLVGRAVNYTQVFQGLAKSILSATDNALTSLGLSGYLTAMGTIIPQFDRPVTIDDAVARLQAIGTITKADPSIDWFNYAALLRSANLVDSADSLLSFVNGVIGGENSMSNVFNPLPPQTIYPQKASTDPAYSVAELTLRSAIYIPPGFTKGQKPPVILFTATAETGYTSYKGNFIPLLQNSDFADPVWVNVPGYDLGDVQVNSEYAAYAMNYIASITGKNVTVVTFSQGGIDVQWALKYWPSTRKVTSDVVAISPDYKGTQIAGFVAPNGVASPPAIIQQKYVTDSKFIQTLRKNGGDSAYVPTTTIYSSFFDEAVQPQSGTTASAYLLDARGVGVTNNEVQKVCAGKIAGSFYTHESLLVNPLGLALLKDAMTHDGPGRPERLNLNSVCSTYLAPGLNVGDFLVTENTILVAALAFLGYQPKVTAEPPIKAYAA